MYDILLTGLVGFSLITSGFLLGKTFWIDRGVSCAVKILERDGYIRMRGDTILKVDDSEN